MFGFRGLTSNLKYQFLIVLHHTTITTKGPWSLRETETLRADRSDLKDISNLRIMKNNPFSEGWGLPIHNSYRRRDRLGRSTCDDVSYHIRFVQTQIALSSATGPCSRLRKTIELSKGGLIQFGKRPKLFWAARSSNWRDKVA